MNLFWLLRMSQWARNPPSPRKVILVLGVVAFCIGLYAMERWGILPDWASAQRIRWR